MMNIWMVAQQEGSQFPDVKSFVVIEMRIMRPARIVRWYKTLGGAERAVMKHNRAAVGEAMEGVR